MHKLREIVQNTTMQIKHKKEVVSLTRKNRYLLKVKGAFIQFPCAGCKIITCAFDVNAH